MIVPSTPNKVAKFEFIGKLAEVFAEGQGPRRAVEPMMMMMMTTTTTTTMIIIIIIIIIIFEFGPIVISTTRNL
jgi:hypothetical protein